ncbi:MAG: RNA polymerase sigma factor [Coprobacillus sp.]|nr:RNA polymerase sigma factor [Coprobacillus sp.]
MNKISNEELNILIDKANNGDKKALETVILSIQDLVFNLSFRMLGTKSDAEDASQDIILKIVTHLSTFKKQSAFSTWVFSIASNHLKNYKKHMFAKAQLSFDFYGNDIKNANIENLPDMTNNVDKAILAEELKFSCTNVMLQCLDSDSRCIFILGTMFKINSQIASEILGISSDSYRQKLSRARKKMAQFLSEYCGEYGNGKCMCKDRINYAIMSHRLNPHQLDYTTSSEISLEKILDVTNAMENIDHYSEEFSFCKTYKSPEIIKKFIKDLLNSIDIDIIKNS